MGGAKWLKEQRGASLDIDELAPKPEPFCTPRSFGSSSWAAWY